ncbi:MAG: hypothetical protein CMN72_00390 [Sphingomonas sp.]|nr:hypothetical protein [Sphingomonas sp.]
MRYEHFLFYALLRNKPVETATHDTESGSFREIIFELKSAADIGAGYYLNSILDIFPLYKEQVINIIISSKL